MLPAEVPLSVHRAELVGLRRLGDEGLTRGVLDVAVGVTLDTLAGIDVTELTTLTEAEATLGDIR